MLNKSIAHLISRVEILELYIRALSGPDKVLKISFRAIVQKFSIRTFIFVCKYRNRIKKGSNFNKITKLAAPKFTKLNPQGLP